MQINGYTTDAFRHITLTVAGASQVVTGTSQRHTGIAGTGAVLRPPAAAPYGISVEDAFTVVEWLDVDGTNVTTSTADGVQVEFGNGQDALLRNLLLHDWDVSSGAGLYTALDRVTLRTSILYANNVGIQLDGNDSVVQNVTIHGSTGGYGFQDAASSGHTVENVISVGNASDDFCCGNVPTFNNNISSDVTATAYYTGSGNQTFVSASSLFENTATASIDLHLRPGAEAIDAGKDLSGAFTNDIDDQTRHLGNAWDIGADETGYSPVTTNYRSIGTAADHVNVGTVTVTAGSPTVTGVGTGWLAANRGRGDRFSVGGSDYVILSVDSDTQLTLDRLAVASHDDRHLHHRPSVHDPRRLGELYRRADGSELPVLPGDLGEPGDRRPRRGGHRLRRFRVHRDPGARRLGDRRHAHHHPHRGSREPTPGGCRDGSAARQRQPDGQRGGDPGRSRHPGVADGPRQLLRHLGPRA